MRWWWSLATLPLLGCPTASPDDDDSSVIADDDDDDDSTTPNDDDSAPADDDDSAPGDDDDSAEPAFDLSDPAVVVERFFHTVELRFALHTHRLGSAAGDDLCPSVAGEDPEVLTGGCTSADGRTFEGTLERTTTTVEAGGLRTEYVGTGWRVAGAGAGFLSVGLDGTGTVETTGDDDAGVGDWQMDGTIEYDPAGPTAGLLPPVVVGQHALHVEWGPESADRHVFTADLLVPDAGRYTADLQLDKLDKLDKLDGPCDAYAETSHARIEAAGRTAELLVASDPEPCDLCFPWVLDGVAQPEPACIQLR